LIDDATSHFLAFARYIVAGEDDLDVVNALYEDAMKYYKDESDLFEEPME